MVEIYGTLGPACSNADVLEQMLRNGMTGVRLNLSHVTIYEAAPMINALREAEARCAVSAKLLIDMQGPELRIQAMDKPLMLERGDTVLLGGGGIPVPELVEAQLLPGQAVLIDDGKLLLNVTERTAQGAKAEVIRGGRVTGRKSIALPGSNIYPPTMTRQDIENISAAAEYGVTGVMQPFVRGKDDLLTVRRALDDAGCGDIRIFAKIENKQGVDNLDELIAESDEIVIARGDLGNAMPLWELPGVQKRISAKCAAAGKPFMVVTQMLMSMENSPVPTRAEVSDIYNAVTDGAASVMVTGETAVGKYPAEVIKYLANTSREAERDRELWT